MVVFAAEHIYRLLLQTHGKQGWWPADSVFEVVIGSVLTQNTAWKNVEKAILQLKKVCPLDAHYILKLGHDALADAIRPSGYFNIKAKRLRNICEWWIDWCSQDNSSKNTDEIRKSLLKVNGIGPETADDILLYALGRPVFVIDTYTRRIFERLGLVEADWNYETLRQWFETSLATATADSDRVQLFNEYHALIVKHAKDICQKKQPLCEQCCLQVGCSYAHRSRSCHLN
ncbi:MAG: endonuclease [Gammaproteobacteria bacterium]|nr:MAG: endonuclease [Gammaproteobacteria bacterium]